MLLFFLFSKVLTSPFKFGKLEVFFHFFWMHCGKMSFFCLHIVLVDFFVVFAVTPQALPPSLACLGPAF